MNRDSLLNEMMGRSLRALTKLANSPMVERLGLEERAQQWVYEGTKRAVEGATKAADRFASGKGGGRSQRLFDLRPTDEQALMQETLRRFADDVIRPAATAADEACALPATFLSDFRELGATEFLVPEELGGVGSGPTAVSTMLIAEQLARADMGFAYAALAPLSVVQAIIRYGTEEQRHNYAARALSADGLPASFAWMEPAPLFDAAHLSTKAAQRGDGFVLTGTKSAVALGQHAELLLVAADTGRAGPRLFLVETDAPGVRIDDEPAMGLRSAALSRVTLDKVKVPASALVGDHDLSDKAAAHAFGDMLDRAHVAWGALAVGCAQAVLDYVIPYCNDRVAFGEPISHRQAVAFMIANVGIELESMRMLVYRAAGRLDAGLPAQREAYLAKQFCGEKAMEIGTNGVQLLGGAGYIKDHPIELWYRHLRAVGAMEGNLVV